MERRKRVTAFKAVIRWIDREKYKVLLHDRIFWKSLIEERDGTFATWVKPRKRIFLLLLCDLPCTWVVNFLRHDFDIVLKVIFHLDNNELTNFL